MKAVREKFRQNNNQRELHKNGGKIPHSLFRHIKHGGVSYIPGVNSYPSNVTLSAIPPMGGRIRRYHGNGFFDNVGAWFRNLFNRSNTNQIASNLFKKALPFVTGLAGDILADQALHANPLDTIKRHAFKSVKNLLNEKHNKENDNKPEYESTGGIVEYESTRRAVQKSTNNRAKAAYKRHVRKTKGGAILVD